MAISSPRRRVGMKPAPSASSSVAPFGVAIVKPVGIVNLMVLDRSPRLDVVFHALAHPARRAIIRQLSGGERNLSELAAPLRMTFPAPTKHVRVLARAPPAR